VTAGCAAVRISALAEEAAVASHANASSACWASAGSCSGWPRPP